jgi:hypothetical protein
MVFNLRRQGPTPFSEIQVSDLLDLQILPGTDRPCLQGRLFCTHAPGTEDGVDVRAWAHPPSEGITSVDLVQYSIVHELLL